MADVVRGVMAHEMDTDLLFERFTIDEIRDVEKKTRSDIEKKKEDLRQMVGERYRELIEAADTITEMKISAENVVQSISKVQELGQGLKQKYLAQGIPSMTRVRKDSQRKRDESQFYGIAAQIKLLLDMPEKLWSAVEGRSYLQASQLFLLARHINTGLQRDSQQSAKILSWFPVLARQWAAISHFRMTILQACRDTLKEVDISDQLAAECLCTIMLLEDTTPRQVFNELLLIRTSAVQQLFQPDQSEVSIKSQVCNVVQMIVTTVHQIYAVFHSGGDTQDGKVDCNLLMQILGRVTNKGAEGAIIVGIHNYVALSHLPDRVSEFRPSLQKHVAAISSQNLQDNCQQWVNTCVQTVSTGLSKLLGYITTIKGLAAIRDELWTLLKQDEKMLTWEQVCKEVVQRPLHLWEEFFQEHFVARNKALLQSQFDNTLSQSKQQVTKALADLSNVTDRSMQAEHDLSSYMWVETPGDIPPNTAWVPSSNKTLAESGTLLMKAKAYTPAVQMLCRSVDSKLKVLLEDATFYLQPAGEANKDVGPFDKFANNDEIQQFLQSACKTCIERLLEFLKNQLYASKQQLQNSEDVQANMIILDGVILLGRLSSAIGELSINLEKCMLGGAGRPDIGRLGRGSKKTLGIKSKSASPESPHWNSLKEQLVEFIRDTYSVWTEYTADLLVRQFHLVLLDNGGQALLRSTACWDEIEIQEETEEGQTVKSTIRVPMQASWYVQSLLYQLCEEINRVGGHAIQRQVVQNLVTRLSDGLVQSYNELLDSAVDRRKAVEGVLPLSQVRALQLLFDFRLITAILARKDENEGNNEHQTKCRQIVDRLEAVVDPFDLDVFSPYISNHLARQQQRTSVLYGALGALDRHGLYSNPRPALSGQQEQHNVFPLSTGHSRFPLLPLSATQSRSHIPPVLQAPKPQGSVTPLGPSSPPPTLPSSPGPTSSFLGTMSTIWFTNVASKKK